MRIVNPLYDKTFKYLMQNERMAKKVMDEDFRRQLQAEEDIDTIFDNQEAT